MFCRTWLPVASRRPPVRRWRPGKARAMNWPARTAKGSRIGGSDAWAAWVCPHGNPHKPYFNRSVPPEMWKHYMKFPKRLIHRPSGKRLHNYGKSPLLMGKSTISMVIFNSYVGLVWVFLWVSWYGGVQNGGFIRENPLKIGWWLGDTLWWTYKTFLKMAHLVRWFTYE